jgi:NAD(P)-dependent dehydrogenase (short-subunit alcohol dehydrogenase family)
MGFLVALEAAKRMLPRAHGAILFTGASASVKGYPQSAPFAMGKFALRGLAQSMARELAPQGIHVAHFVIDGAIRNPGRTEPPDRPQSMLDPDAIAQTYLHVLQQPRSAWTWEAELPAVGREVLNGRLSAPLRFVEVDRPWHSLEVEMAKFGEVEPVSGEIAHEAGYGDTLRRGLLAHPRGKVNRHAE